MTSFAEELLAKKSRDGSRVFSVHKNLVVLEAR